MAEVKNVPKLRFPGFTEPWEQRMFSECYKITSGYAFKMSDYCDTGVGLINGESIQHGIINDDNLNHLPESFIQQYPEFLLKESDIVVGLNRPITNGNLKIARILSKYNNSLLYQRAGKIVYKTNCDKDFTYVLLSREILKYTLVEAVGSDQPFISTSKLDNWKMMIPSDTEEQSKIGKYFSCLDNLITLHQRKYETLLEYKKGLLQKMFPKAGETVPEIRFPGFDGEWEEHELVEMFKYEQPTKYIVGNDDYEGCSKFPVLTANKGFILGYTDETDGVYDKGDVIIFDDFTCDHKFVNFPFKVKSSAIKLLTSKENYDLQFLSKLLNSIDQKPLSHQRHWISVMQPTTVLAPSLEEQQKIGSFFKALDEKIELQKQKVDAIKEYKKGLLQQMFV